MSASIMRVPDPLDSDRADARYYNEDLPHLSPRELSRELDTATVAIALVKGESDRDWWFRRRAAVLAELHARGFERIR